MKDIKFLYESTVKKQVEEKVTETREENGEKIEISRNVKKAKPIKIAIQKPNRKLYEGAERFYAVQIADFIKAGLLPYSLVQKRYANDGGPLSEPEKQYLIKLKEEAASLENKYFSVIESDGDVAKQRNELLVKINNINAEVSNIQNGYADIFENTAEMKARNKTIEWWVLHLSYIDEDGTGYKPLFGDGTHEDKLNKYDDFDDREDKFTNECIRKMSYLISFWFAAKSSLSKIDFESMDRLYTDTLADYSVEEEKVEVKVEDKTPVPEKPVETT
jgi:hypothetical protein